MSNLINLEEKFYRWQQRHGGERYKKKSNKEWLW